MFQTGTSADVPGTAHHPCYGILESVPQGFILVFATALQDVAAFVLSRQRHFFSETILDF